MDKTKCFYWKSKNTKDYYSKKDAFICEICHCVTPIECEGSQPNTYADCIPINFNEK